MRAVLIHRNARSVPADPTYDVVDLGRHNEERGFADTLLSLRRQQVGDWLVREGMGYSAIERVLAELQQRGEAQLELPPRVGPRILRAWFDTVINPLVRALESELLLLGKRNWTFSLRPARLELIRPLRGYLEYEALANLDQILKAEVGIAPNAETHDEAVEGLRSSVASLHAFLSDDDGFQELCDSLTTTERLNELGMGSLVEIFGAFPASDGYALLAQDVVNNMGEQSPYYSSAKFWNRNRVVLLQALEFPGIRERYTSAIQLGEHLASVTRALLKELKDLRDQLSLRYDVPLVAGTH